jgi:hypothetical protein
VRGRFLPVDLRGLDRLARIPPVIGDDRHRAGQAMHRDHPAHGLDLVLVANGADRQPQTRRVLDGRMDHALDLGIDCIFRLAGRFHIDVEPGDRLADPAEISLVLERHAARRRGGHVEGMGRQRAIGDRPARRRMDDPARLGRELRHRHAQMVGPRTHQHEARGGAQLAHGGIAGADRAASAGHPPSALRDEVIGAHRRRLDHETGRIGVHFLADDLRERGEDALPAFHERAEQVDRAVRFDRKERGNADHGCARRHCRAGLADGQADAEHEGTSPGPGCPCKETAARHIGRVPIDTIRRAHGPDGLFRQILNGGSRFDAHACAPVPAIS